MMLFLEIFWVARIVCVLQAIFDDLDSIQGFVDEKNGPIKDKDEIYKYYQI